MPDQPVPSRHVIVTVSVPVTEPPEVFMSDPDAFTIDDALVIAAHAHRGQRDKGRPAIPYLTHPIRVMSTFDDPTLQIIGVLHDVVEDSGGEVTLETLAAAGAPARVIAALEAITHPDGESNEDYWARVRVNPDALAVKQADIADNTDPKRLALLDAATADRLRAKYQAARSALGID